MARMAEQEIAIHLQNVMDYFKFFMAHPGFWYNQIYEPSHIYNENEQQVYNEIYINK